MCVCGFYRLSEMLDLTAEDLTNQNLYDFCHAEDLQKLRQAHVDRESCYETATKSNKFDVKTQNVCTEAPRKMSFMENRCHCI